MEKFKGHFSYKWKKIKASARNQNVERTLNQNYKSSYYCKPIYGIDQINYIESICDINYKEKILNHYGMITDIETRVQNMKPILENYVFCFQSCVAKPIHFSPSKFSLKHEQIQDAMQENLLPGIKSISDNFHFSSVRQKLVFPDKKFLIYDCGKMNTMMQLLIQLKAQKHKVLIFTQMSKMLDLFEFSLNVFHMTYVRLDGATRPDLRQKLVERFNQDQKIFCFISSTRSGGIGINLTGADTVIFYDTDWNPAMDKQA